MACVADVDVMITAEYPVALAIEQPNMVTTELIEFPVECTSAALQPPTTSWIFLGTYSHCGGGGPSGQCACPLLMRISQRRFGYVGSACSRPTRIALPVGKGRRGITNVFKKPSKVCVKL